MANPIADIAAAHLHRLNQGFWHKLAEELAGCKLESDEAVALLDRLQPRIEIRLKSEARHG